jgi:predicted short-subunit dehydrogenase-like oxidoreductase (DUF2520 family)
MIKIALIGSGNLAQHLIRTFTELALSNSNIELIQVFSRDKKKLSTLLDSEKIISNFQDLKKADLYLIAVSDDAIATVSSQLPFTDRLVVHTSGAASLLSLDAKNRRGVFYPLQSFSKDKIVDFKSVPICLESEKSADFVVLNSVANAISNSVFAIDSEQRKALHVAAVFVNNFTNHLYQLANDICTEHQVPFETLIPLIQETAHKITTLNPEQAQTGPAKRNDKSTIEAHESFLTNKNQSTIYKLLTQSIQNHGKKL